MAETRDAYVEQLKAFALQLVEHAEVGSRAGSEGPFFQHIEAVLRRISSKRDIEVVVGDLLEWARSLAPTDVATVDSLLAGRDLPTLSRMLSVEDIRFRGIIARGKVRNDDEYRLLDARLGDMTPNGPTTLEREMAGRLLATYKQ